MGLFGKSSLLHLLLVFLMGLLGVLVVIIMVNSLSHRDRSGDLPENINSEEIKFTFYNIEENRKLFEFRAAEEIAEENSELDRVHMRGVRVQVYPRGELDQDLVFTSRRGYRERGDNDFYFAGECRIHSRDLALESREFFLKNRNLLSTSAPVAVQIRTLTGSAREGLEYNIRNHFILMKGFSGIADHEGKKYRVTADEVIIRKGRVNKISLQGHVTVREGESRILAQVLTLVYRDAFQTLRLIRARRQVVIKRVTLQSGRRRSIEIRGDHQVLRYNRKGIPRLFTADEGAQFHLEDDRNTTRAGCRESWITLDPKTGAISRIHLKQDAWIRNRGNRDFDLRAQQVRVRYNSLGEIVFCRGNTDCRFELDDFSSTSDILQYFIPRDLFAIFTRKEPDPDRTASLHYRSDLFTSPSFSVDTKNRVLTSGEGIKSVIRFDQKNLLFDQGEIFILSDQVRIEEEPSMITYSGNVRVQQRDTRMTAGELTVTRQSRITARRDIRVTVVNPRETMNLTGQEMQFNLPDRRLEIRDQASLTHRSSYLQGDRIVLNIGADHQIRDLAATDPGKVRFMREDIRGESRQLFWDFSTSQIRFLQDAVIQKKKVKTGGNEILLNLETSDIQILTPGRDRSETVIDEPRK